MAIKVVPSSSIEEDGYLESIKAMAAIEFPGSQGVKAQSTFEAVVHELIGTKQHRLGPTPDPESLVEIRKVVRNAMDAEEPIPVLVPWGASKQGPFGVDVAEVMALKQIACLSRRVKQHYNMGVWSCIRLEDLTDHEMFRGSRSQQTEEYSKTFAKLHAVMDIPLSHVIRESAMVSKQIFSDQVSKYSGDLLEAIMLPEDQRGRYLAGHLPEWKGKLGNEQLDHYRRVYEKFYPDESRLSRDSRLATYFASSLARLVLGATGARATWDGYITMAFTANPWGRSGSRIYYRTIPERYTNQHRAPWIGKGYVRIRGREASPAIAGWDGDGLEYVPAKLQISSEHGLVEVGADYVVSE